MRTLSIIKRRMLKQLWKSIIAFFFVALAVFMSNLAFSYYRYLIHVNNFVKSTGLYGRYAYIGIPTKLVYNDGDMAVKYNLLSDTMEDRLSELKESGKISDYFYTNAIGDSYCFPQEFLTDVSLSVDKGKWFDKASFRTNQIPVVVGYDLRNDYKIGTVFSLDYIEKELIVIGTLKKNELFLVPTGSGSRLAFGSITGDFDKNIIIGLNTSPGLAGTYFSAGTIVKLSEDKNADFNGVLSSVANLCNTFTFEDMAKWQQESSSELIKMQGILAIMSLMVCFVGVSCINLLGAVNEKKTDCIYMLCGMSKKQAYSIIGIEGIIKELIPAILGLIWFFSYLGKNDIDYAYTDGWNVFFTMILVIIIFVISSLYPLKQISELSPAEVIISE